MDRIPIRHINKTKKEQDLSESFSIRDIQGLLAGKDMVQHLHRHDFFYILALKKGTGSHTIDFLPYTVCDNSIFIIRPGQVHQLALKAGSKGYLIQFRDEFYLRHDKAPNQLLRKAGQVNHYQLNANGFQKLFTILIDIFGEYTGKQEGFEDVIKANLNIFFIGLARQYSSGASRGAGLYIQEQLEKFLALLETHIYTHKQVSQYAGLLNLSTYQLNAIAKATLGKTCSELITAHIVLEAKRCLLATSNQVSQVAYRLGYEDASYFTRFFKKHTGHSPEAFRHNSI